MDMKLVGKTIAALRKKNGYTQEALADKMGISPQAVSKWETGLGLPEASSLIELSDLFRVSIDSILQPGKLDRIPDFIRRNTAAPLEKILEDIPQIDRWNPPEGCDMYYSMPAMIAAALCAVEAQEQGQPVTLTDMNERFRELMHIMGVGYGFLWTEKRNMIEELWRMNDLQGMAERAMGYYGRDYVWLTTGDATPEDMRRLMIWSINKGRPVVMEWAGGIPEFSIVTGYKDNGHTLTGWTYCGECAAGTNEKGMFVTPARWNESFQFHMLVIGDAVDSTYTDKESIGYALKVLERGKPEDTYITEAVAGDAALHKWLEACDCIDNTLRLFHVNDIFTHALYMNSIYTQKCILSYYKKLSISHDRNINDIITQISIAVSRLEGERHGLDAYRDKPVKLAAACKGHIESLIRHRVYMRGWLGQLYALL